MSRALFLSLDEGTVVTKCLAEKVGISHIERLPGGGVRLVCMSGEGAVTMARKLKANVMVEPVTRAPTRPPSQRW